ncbi:hypothetical protein BV22DRAFT_854825 [Leucogyrophana mollusca]|uniref:Uncharacterized protein n=1 Tax=Leucogyrophana mollusca TaxID=85980 RepID=A0ACB8B330_9AGAM|nr:hypothetical protein BV22DRAFT_854825 [Leucogyrophana mollusca]
MNSVICVFPDPFAAFSPTFCLLVANFRAAERSCTGSSVKDASCILTTFTSTTRLNSSAALFPPWPTGLGFLYLTYIFLHQPLFPSDFVFSQEVTWTLGP